MKKKIHPDYHDITIVLTDKTKFQTRSTYGKAGAELVLDIDPRVHPAWTGGGQHLIDRSGQLSKFNKRYEQFNLGSGKAKPVAPPAPPAPLEVAVAAEAAAPEAAETPEKVAEAAQPAEAKDE